MKQIDFAIRVFPMNPAGTEGTWSRSAVHKELTTEFPYEDGWKVESVSPVGLLQGNVNVLVFLARYEYDSLSLISSQVESMDIKATA